MDVRDVLIVSLNCEHGINHTEIADLLIANGVTITPAVPGPSENDPNIMEMCFRNGERHEKDKIIAVLKDVLEQAEGPCMIDVENFIKIVEEL